MLKVGRFILRWTGYFTEFVFGLIALYLTVAIFLSLVPSGNDVVQDGIKIYVKTNGVHTDL
jgi:hypothetical protein